MKSKEMALYIDGVRQSQTGFFNGPIGISDQHLNLGRNERWSNNYSNAAFSEIRIWDRVRTEDEIRASMNKRLTGNELGLVGYWPFNKDTGTIAKNGLNGRNDGTNINPIWQTAKILPFSSETTVIEVSTGHNNLEGLLTLQGILEYRNGKIEQATKTLESARIGGTRRPEHMLFPDNGINLQWLVLAQCYHQLGEKEKASSLLKLANERMTEETFRQVDWQERHLLNSLLGATRKMLRQE